MSILLAWYIVSIVLAAAVMIKDHKNLAAALDECVDEIDGMIGKVCIIILMLICAPFVDGFYIVTKCIDFFMFVKYHHTNKKIGIDTQLNKLPRLMTEYDRLLRKSEGFKITVINKHYEPYVEHVKLRNWDEK